MTARFIDWIWHIRGSLALAPQQSSDDAFGKLDPLFRQAGTSHNRISNRLTFRKKDQAAQDKMAIFDGGVLQIEQDATGPVLRYHLTSRALLFCFVMPLVFLAFAQFTIALGKFEKPPVETASKMGKAPDTSKRPEKKEVEQPQNPIDKALGAPAPDKPKKDGAGKSEKQDKKHSPTSAYVFAGIFATLYAIGRILEDRQVKALFQKRLLGS